MTSPVKQVLLAAGSILVIAASLYSVCPYLSSPGVNMPLHESVGQAMAEQTTELLGNAGQVAVITLNGSEFPILKAQLDGFKKTLRRGRIQIAKTIVLNTKGQAKYGPGRGLSTQKFLQIRDQYRNLDAIVSFVGVPNLEDEEIKKLQGPAPKIVAETKFGERLVKLME